MVSTSKRNNRTEKQTTKFGVKDLLLEIEDLSATACGIMRNPLKDLPAPLKSVKSEPERTFSGS
jgi:hypothetical protein